MVASAASCVKVLLALIRPELGGRKSEVRPRRATVFAGLRGAREGGLRKERESARATAEGGRQKAALRSQRSEVRRDRGSPSSPPPAPSLLWTGRPSPPSDGGEGGFIVEVGTLVAQRPPHRSRRAVFPHRALQFNTLYYGPLIGGQRCSVILTVLVSSASRVELSPPSLTSVPSCRDCPELL